MRLFCFLLLGFSLLVGMPSRLAAELSVSLNENSEFVLTGFEPQLLGVQFESASGLLVPSAEDVPFDFTLSNRETVVTYGTLRKDLSVDGKLVLPVRLEEGAINDVLVQYGNLTKTYELRPIAGESIQWTEPIYRPSMDMAPGVPGLERELTSVEVLVQMHHEEQLIANVRFPSLELRDAFHVTTYGAYLEVDGERGEFYHDGTSSLPDGWSRFDIDELNYVMSLPRDVVASPEPASCMMFLLGCGILLTRRRRSQLTS